MPYSGSLIVKVTFATGAYPVEGATVRVQGRNADTDTLLYVQNTDRDGNTEVLTLPAPDPKLSQTPHPSATPYTMFDVDVYNAGFYPKTVYSVSVFPGILTVLPVNLIPYSEFDPQDNAPVGTQNVIAQENSQLS